MRNPLLSALKGIHHRVGGHGLGQSRILKNTYDFFYRLFKPNKVIVRGHTMYLDERDTLELATRETYEPLETSLFERFIRPGDLVIDLGANIGYFTLLAARLCGPSGKVLSFEPDPTNFSILKKNVTANDYRNVELHPEAVSDRPGEARLYLNDINRGDHRLFDPGDGRPSVSVQVVALDPLLKNNPLRRTFIKMDIQGSEWKALAGMKEFLTQSAEVVLISEFWPMGLSASGGSAEGLLKMLKDLGFSLFEVDEVLQLVTRTDTDRLIKKVPQDRDIYTNLLALKGVEPDPAWGS